MTDTPQGQGDDMAANTTEVTLPDGTKAQAREVAVEASNERWSEYTLADGTMFRAKLNIVGVWVVEGKTDQRGNPMLFINGAPTVAVTSVGASTTDGG